MATQRHGAPAMPLSIYREESQRVGRGVDVGAGEASVRFRTAGTLSGSGECAMFRGDRELGDRTVGHSRPTTQRQMILRAWRGFASLADEERYPEHLLATVKPRLGAISGFRGLYLLRRRDGSEVEYQVLTYGTRWIQSALLPGKSRSGRWLSPRLRLS